MIDLATLKEFAWCAPLAVALGAIWSRLWKAHRRNEELVDRILSGARGRKPIP